MQKNPNGYGTVYKLSGKNRKRPYVVRRTVGWKTITKKDGTKKEVQQYEVIGYYEDYKTANAALTAYWKGGVKQAAALTFTDLYDEWSAVHFSNISMSTERQYVMAFKHFKSLHNVPFANLRTSHYQQIINKSKLKKGSLEKLKILASTMYEYAIQNDICTKNYASYIVLPKADKKEKEIFTDSDIKKLWDNKDMFAIDTILILIYTGMRINEMLKLTRFDIDLKNNTITGGLKTSAGKNRVIPIHPKILPFIQARYVMGERLFPFSYEAYRISFDAALDALGIKNKTPHCTRHTFATLMARKGADAKALQKIIGHANYSTTADIYTHLDIADLKKEIEKL